LTDPLGGLNLAQEPLEIWKRVVPDASAIALSDVVFRASSEAYELCKKEYPGYQPLSHIVGWNRFTKLQFKLLDFGEVDPVLKSKQKNHSNHLPFTQLHTPELQITTASVDSDCSIPQLSLFRKQEQDQQLKFFDDRDNILICHLCIRVEGDLSVPKSVGINFPDGNGGYLTDQYIDLTKLKRAAPILPVEKVADNPMPRERSREGNIARDHG